MLFFQCFGYFYQCIFFVVTFVHKLLCSLLLIAEVAVVTSNSHKLLQGLMVNKMLNYFHNYHIFFKIRPRR